MKQSDLEKRRQILNIAAGDADDDFEEIVVSTRSAVSADAKITMLPIESLVEFTDDAFEVLTGRPQPFKAYGTENLESLAKSIKANGVINPITVKPLEDGRYRILAGRNRARASKLCGKQLIPAIIRADIDDVGAAMIMLDTNLEQRPNLSYSEKAYAYKMRMDLYRKQGKRTDLTGDGKQDTLSEVGKEGSNSRRTVAYLIRLTYLIPAIMEMVDDGKLGFKIGVAVSYLTEKTQALLYSQIMLAGYKIKQSQIKELKILDACGAVNEESLRALFIRPEKPKYPSITISGEALREYADILPDSKEVERLFLEFLKKYRCSVN